MRHADECRAFWHAGLVCGGGFGFLVGYTLGALLGF